MTEGAGVIHGIAQDFFYIVSRFAERNGLCIDRAFQRFFVAPLPRPAGAGGLSGGGQQRLIIGYRPNVLEILSP